MRAAAVAVVFARAFFELQLDFAATAARLTGRPVADTLLDYTNLYVRFGLGRDFDPANPAWQGYIAGLRVPGDRGEWTYRFYLARGRHVAPPDLVASFGCFSYARLGTDRIRLHFRATEHDGGSPLRKERRHRRMAELAALFAHVEATIRAPVRVAGASWLYNLDAYRRLFPESYVATARVMRNRFRHMPLWGQFLTRHGDVRAGLVSQFRERLARQTTAADLDDCFPFQVLAVEAAVSEFHDFYGV